VFVSVLFTQTVNAASSVLLYTNVNKKNIKLNEMTTILALSAEANSNLPPDSIKIYKDNDKEAAVSCVNAYSCSHTFWESDIKKTKKWVKFKIVSTYQKTTATKVVWVYVKKEVAKPKLPKMPDISAFIEKPSNALVYDKVVTNGHQPKVGEYFTADLYPSYPDMLSGVIGKLDGKNVIACSFALNVKTCPIKTGPFTDADVGEHKYEFVMQDKSGNTNVVWGKYWVNPKANTNDGYPEYDKMVVQNYNLIAGQYFKASVYAKQGQKIYSVKGYVEGNDLPQMVCSNLSECTMEVGTSADYMVGEHQFKFVLTAENGKSVTLNGKFNVVKAEEKDLTAPNVVISSDKDSLKLGESAVVTATASDNKAVSKIQILVFSGVVKECVNTNVCTYPIGPVTDKTYVSKFTYGAVAYDAAGNNMFTGNKYINVDVAQPVIVEPVISVEASKVKITSTDTVNFKAVVNSGSKKLTNLQLIVNKALAKQCFTETCEHVGGPYPSYVGSVVNYAATAYFSDGTSKTSGYSFIPVTNAPTVSIVSSPSNPTDTSAVMFTANVNNGDKSINFVSITVNNTGVKACQEAVCTYMGGPYKEYGGKSITYSAKVFFTDGTTISTDTQTLNIYSTVQQVSPTISLKADKSTVIEKEAFVLLSTLDQGTKKAELWTIYHGDATLGNGAVAQYCNTGLGSCTYNTYLLNQSGSYYAEAKFSDGTIYKSGNVKVELRTTTTNTNSRS